MGGTENSIKYTRNLIRPALQFPHRMTEITVQPYTVNDIHHERIDIIEKGNQQMIVDAIE